MTSVEPIGERSYRGVGPEEDKFLIRPRFDEELGVVNFEIDAGGTIECSRSRLFDTDETSCLLVHVAIRWEGVDDHYWGEHKRGTDDDLARMKRLIEVDSSA